MKYSNLNTSVATLLNKYSVEDILFTLHSQVDNQLRNDNQDPNKLKLQVQALDTACEMLEELDQDNTFCLIY